MRAQFRAVSSIQFAASFVFFNLIFQRMQLACAMWNNFAPGWKTPS